MLSKTAASVAAIDAAPAVVSAAVDETSLAIESKYA
jgi:hypothetical protein